MDRDVSLNILTSLTNIKASVQSIATGSANQNPVGGTRGNFSSGDNETKSINEEPVTKDKK